VSTPGQVQSITTRGGRSTRDPPYPKGTTRRQATPVIPTVTEEKDDEVEELEPLVPEMMQDFHDSNILPLGRRKRKTKVDEQFSKFVEVIQKLYINVPLLDALQVPTYARYIRDILNNKQPLPTTKVNKLTKECSVPSSTCHQRRRRIQDAPLLIVQLETNISITRYVTLEQVLV
jgi:hypothetical protein